MTATSTYRATKFKGLIPSRVTLPMAANTLILGGTMVARDSSGRAVVGTDDNNAYPVIGKASADFDNRTTAPEGGGAGAINCEIECGVFEWAYTGSAPTQGVVVYCVDNQTVSTDSDSGTRGIAGYVVSVNSTAGTCYVWMGPHVAGQIVIAASEASQLDTAQADIVELQTDAQSAQCFIPIPLNSWRVASDGSAIAAFSNGVADGFSLVDSECFGIRFNDDTTAALATSVALPPDLDDSADIVIHALAFRVGSADTTVVLTFGAFFQTVGAAHTADADCGGNSDAIDAATTVVEEVTRTISAADVPAAPCSLTLTMVPSAALDDDDLVVTATWLEYTRQFLTS